jgi:hypothetical protein
MFKIMADIFVIRAKSTRCILNEVTAFSYGKRDDRALGGTEPFKHALGRFESIQVTDKRSDNAIALLIGIYLQEPVQEVLLRQRQVYLFVPWEQAYSEFTPAFRLSASQQVIKINREMRAVKTSNPDMHKPRKGAASIIPGTCDCVRELTKGGIAEWSRDPACVCEHVTSSGLSDRIWISVQGTN